MIIEAKLPNEAIFEHAQTILPVWPRAQEIITSLRAWRPAVYGTYVAVICAIMYGQHAVVAITGTAWNYGLEGVLSFIAALFILFPMTGLYDRTLLRLLLRNPTFLYLLLQILISLIVVALARIKLGWTTTAEAVLNCVAYSIIMCTLACFEALPPYPQLAKLRLVLLFVILFVTGLTLVWMTLGFDETAGVEVEFMGQPSTAGAIVSSAQTAVVLFFASFLVSTWKYPTQMAVLKFPATNHFPATEDKDTALGIEVQSNPKMNSLSTSPPRKEGAWAQPAESEVSAKLGD